MIKLNIEDRTFIKNHLLKDTRLETIKQAENHLELIDDLEHSNYYSKLINILVNMTDEEFNNVDFNDVFEIEEEN